MEMHQIGPTYQRHDGTIYQTVDRLTPWQPGFFRRLPLAGLSAIIGAFLGIIASVVILVYSDGKPISSWTFQPTVYLAIAATITNILLAFALSEGVDIAWWRKATRQRTTVDDLHQVWSQGNGIKAALLAGRKTTLVGVACLFATLAQINNPLLQRASAVAIRPVPSNITITIRAAQHWPDTFTTAYLSGRGAETNPSVFTTMYTDTVMKWNTGTAISMNGTGCSGKCSAKIKGIGLAVNCSSSKIPYDLNPQIIGSGLNISAPSTTGIQIFKSAFTWYSGSGGNITLSVIHKDSSSCTGDLIVQECLLRVASVNYPVLIDGNKSTIALDPESHYIDDEVESIEPISPQSTAGVNRLGGYYLALQNKYYSNLTMRFSGAAAYIISSQGNTALQYIQINDQKSWNINCSASFINPLQDILQGARELMFRTSIGAANSTSLQVVSADEIYSRGVYHSNYIYLGAAIGVTVLAIIAILVIFRGYSEMGRNITMSPIEIAKAFNAPLLASHDGNASIDDLILSVGTRSVRYGAVRDGGPVHMYNPHEMGYQTEYKPYNPHVQEVAVRKRLTMADEQLVDAPMKGETFTG